MQTCLEGQYFVHDRCFKQRSNVVVLKRGPWASSSSITSQLLERHILRPYLRPAESETLVNPSNLCGPKPSRSFWYTLNHSESCCPRVWKKTKQVQRAGSSWISQGWRIPRAYKHWDYMDGTRAWTLQWRGTAQVNFWLQMWIEWPSYTFHKINYLTEKAHWCHEA